MTHLRVADLSGLAWFKSSHSGNDNACVTVAHAPDFTAVRDGKIPGGPVFAVAPASWMSFLAGVR
jgi:hypothetical protein